MRFAYPTFSARSVLCIAVAMLTLAATGCGGGDDDDNDTAGSGGSGGSTGGSGGEPGETPDPCPDKDPPFEDPNCHNLKCPPIAPQEGDFVQKGKCCFRTSNQDIMSDEEQGDTVTLSYRFMRQETLTQPLTAGSDLINATGKTRQDNDWETLLVRFKGVPRDRTAGEADIEFTLGPGRQNCDGTYSFYGDGAAPEWEGRKDPNRWTARTSSAKWDWNRSDGLPLDVPDEVRHTGLSWAPRWEGSELKIYFEMPVRYFELNIPKAELDKDVDCVGYFDKDKEWNGKPIMTTFVPLQEADQVVVGQAAESLCAILANGVGESEPGKAFTCDEPRVDGANPWTEPPDSVCPADEKDDTPCWIGVKDHPDFKEERDCNETDRPCCDPKGESKELEPCNSWFTKSNIVLGSITVKETADGEIDYITKPEDAPPPVCK